METKSNSVVLNWTTVPSSFTGYKIECENNCSHTGCQNLSSDETTYEVMGLSSNTNYEFKLYSYLDYNCTDGSCTSWSRPCVVNIRTGIYESRILSARGPKFQTKTCIIKVGFYVDIMLIS